MIFNIVDIRVWRTEQYDKAENNSTCTRMMMDMNSLSGSERCHTDGYCDNVEHETGGQKGTEKPKSLEKSE